MIDNIILLITGTLHERTITELIPKCHPLGSFEEMASINIASTPVELYNAVLVDTPLGKKLDGQHVVGNSRVQMSFVYTKSQQNTSLFFSNIFSCAVWVHMGDIRLKLLARCKQSFKKMTKTVGHMHICAQIFDTSFDTWSHPRAIGLYKRIQHSRAGMTKL